MKIHYGSNYSKSWLNVDLDLPQGNMHAYLRDSLQYASRGVLMESVCGVTGGTVHVL